MLKSTKLLITVFFLILSSIGFGQTQDLKERILVITILQSEETRELLTNLETELKKEFQNDYEVDIKNRCCIDVDFDLLDFKGGIYNLFDFASKLEPRNVQALFIYPIRSSAKEQIIEFSTKNEGASEEHISHVKIRPSKTSKFKRALKLLLAESKGIIN